MYFSFSFILYRVSHNITLEHKPPLFFVYQRSFSFFFAVCDVVVPFLSF